MVDSSELTRSPREVGQETDVVLLDEFDRDLAPGRVLGTTCAVGGPRQGVDRERVLSVDHGALRIAWFLGPGWGREGVSWGPIEAVPGLTVVATVVNGLTHSQTSPHPEGRRAAVRRWKQTFPHVVWGEPASKDNLAVGIFRSPVPPDPADGWCFVNRADELDKGELVGVTDSDRSRLVPGLANVSYAYALVVRDDGVMLYAAGPPGTRAVGAHPDVRPLGVIEGSAPPAGDCYVGIHQAVLGEVGYKVDTRVSDIRAVRDPALAHWWTTAHVADPLDGNGALDGRTPAVGPPWAAPALVVGSGGATGDGEAVALADGPSGLVRVVVHTDGPDARTAVVWRGEDRGRWAVELGPEGATLSTPAEAIARVDTRARLDAGGRHTVQVTDDGDTVAAYLDGALLFDGFVDAMAADRDARGVGFTVGKGARVSRFEAHPRAVRIAAVLESTSPWTASGSTSVGVGGFAGPAGPLDSSTGAGPSPWTRLEGAGVFERTGDGRARVRATPDAPNPGRTIYGVPWPHPELVDLTVTVTPPGSGREQGHWALSGLALWQDADNYLIVHQCLGDTNAGISVNVFLRANGVEVMREHDTVWNNVIGHVMHAQPMVLRVVCDGSRFVVHADDELIIARAVTDLQPDVGPLALHQVGLVANWDWGDDTGSVFSDFSARR